MNVIGIDFPNLVSAKWYKKRLASKKTTEKVEGPFQYQFGGPQPEHCIFVTTSMTEKEVDDWLYKTCPPPRKGPTSFGYIGTFDATGSAEPLEPTTEGVGSSVGS